MKRLYITLFVLMIAVILSSSGRITFRILLPAVLELPDYIEAIAIIDRSVSEDTDLSTIEGIITGEGMNQDKLASQLALDGLSEVLQNSSQFKSIRTTEVIKRPGVDGHFPDPLDWETIMNLCDKYQAQAIVVLEGLDSDFLITHGTKKLENTDNNPLGFSIYARGVATVNISFRLYDPAEKAIIDQHHFSHNMSWETDGSSIDAAINTLLNKDAAVREVSYDAGRAYGQRLSPSWIPVSREYYKRSKNDENIAEGARMMESNEWDLAVDALTRAVESGHKKTKGKAAHNLAVVYEILGDLEKAKDWAVTAWGKYKNKGSKDYGYLLTRRINEQRFLENQLKD